MQDNPYFAEEAIAGPVSFQPRWYWTFPPVVKLRWRNWPPSPQPVQMSGGEPVYAPIHGWQGTRQFATTTPAQPEQVSPALTEGLRAPGQADMLFGGAYPIPQY